MDDQQLILIRKNKQKIYNELLKFNIDDLESFLDLAHYDKDIIVKLKKLYEIISHIKKDK